MVFWRFHFSRSVWMCLCWEGVGDGGDAARLQNQRKCEILERCVPFSVSVLLWTIRLFFILLSLNVKIHDVLKIKILALCTCILHWRGEHPSHRKLQAWAVWHGSQSLFTPRCGREWCLPLLCRLLRKPQSHMMWRWVGNLHPSAQEVDLLCTVYCDADTEVKKDRQEAKVKF